MTTAIETHDAMAAAYWQQRQRLQQGEAEDRWEGRAGRFRQDPRRTPEPALQALLEYVRPEDTLLDIGGGAGRYALPIALRCKEAVVVDPSVAMQREFEAAAREDGVDNARFVLADGQDFEGLSGDVTLAAHVTYFVRDIRAFIGNMQRATRRRAIILGGSVPPPNGGAELFELINGEPQALVPSYRQLLPVLWEMGILPEVRIVSQREPGRAPAAFASRNEAIDALLGQNAAAGEERRQRARAAIEASFDSLFEEAAEGFRRRQQADPRLVLITWET